MSPECLKQRRVRAGQRAEGETATCGHWDREWGPPRPRGRVLLSTSTPGRHPHITAPERSAISASQSAAGCAPSFLTQTPTLAHPRGRRRCWLRMAQSLERLPHGWRLLAPGSVIRFQANFIPLCTRVLGIFHDKVMSSRNEINPTHIFMGNGSFLENN